MKKENPNYYSILPASVRYDDRLTANTKLLYSEITALSNKSGKCWASNNYFANLYKVDRRSIINWVNQLKEFNYINVHHVYEEGKKEIKERIITLKEVVKIPSQGGENNFTTSGKNLHEVVKNSSIGSEKNFVDNTIHNTIQSTLNLNSENAPLQKPTPLAPVSPGAIEKETERSIQSVKDLTEEEVNVFQRMTFNEFVSKTSSKIENYELQLNIYNQLKRLKPITPRNKEPVTVQVESPSYVSPALGGDGCAPPSEEIYGINVGMI